MTPRSIQLVRDSFHRLQPVSLELGRCFYVRLFELAPQARPLFPDDVGQQANKLVEMVASIVAALDRPDQLAQMFAAMGRRHVGYGAREAHYDAVGTALLQALHATLGGHWTADIEDAWAEVYGAMAEAMIAAQRAD